MDLVKILIHEKRDQQLIHLKEKGGERGFPIVIGMNEAYEIHRKIQGPKPVRPMTHDLLGALLRATGSEIQRIVVSDLRENTFYATIHLRLATGEITEVDSRPSDAIALAVQFQTPIFVDEDVFSSLGEPPV